MVPYITIVIECNGIKTTENFYNLKDNNNSEGNRYEKFIATSMNQ